MAVEELLIKYKADVSDLQAKVAIIEASLRKVDKSFSDSAKNTAGLLETARNRLRQLQEAREKAFDPAKLQRFNTLIEQQQQRIGTLTSAQGKVINTTSNAFTGLQKAIAPIGGLIAGAFATKTIIAFGRESVKAFQAAELSAKKLQTAVSVSGGLQSDFENLITQASELQNTTIFSDETIQSAQTAALQFGLTADEVEKLIPIISDFASATGQDLNAALDSVLRGIEGQGRGLKLYGVNVDAAASRAENLASITDQLTTKFEGQAEIVGNTGAGAIQKYNNQIDELQEQLGQKLEPLFLSLAEGAVGFTEAIVDSANAIEVLVDEIAAFSFGDFTGKIKRELEDLRKLTEEAKKSNAALVDSFVESFSGLSNAQLKQRFDDYQRLLQGAVEKRKESANASLKEKNALDQDIITYASMSLAIRKVNENRKEQAEANKLSLESLKKLTTAQLEALQVELKTKTDNVSKDALENIVKILEARKKAGEEEKKLLEKFAQEREAAEKAANEKLAQLGVDAIKDQFEQRRAQAQADFDKAEADALEQANKKLISQEKANELIKAAFIKFNREMSDIEIDESDKRLQDRLDQIDNETTAEITALQNAFLEKGDFSVEAQAELDAKIEKAELDGLKKRLEAVDKAQKDTTGAAAEVADKEVKINKAKNDEIIRQEQEAAKKRKEIFDFIIQAASEFTNGLAELSNSILSSRIEALEAEQDAVSEQFDREQEAIDEKVQNRIITEAQGEKQSAELREKRAASEKKAAEAISAVRRKQAEISKQLAIFEATLNLAEAISVALSAAPPPFNATLAAISAALAGAQLATIIATPIPKFFKGEDWVELGRNKPGRDTVPAMLNEGERVVPTEKNVKYWDLYEAIDKNRIDQYVMKTYVVPILQKQQEKKEVEKQVAFAGSIANNIKVEGMNLHDADFIRRKGIKLTNVKELAKEVSKEVSVAVVRALISERGK